ncbi:MAG: nucleotidyltransferase domain-containing protein [Firmicutes bacterium]|nr:nucleotidyltransferase domain-containing protein [Bacillota bacterium]
MESGDHYAAMMKIVSEAVRFSCSKEHLSKIGFFQGMQAGDESIHSRFRYALAIGVSRYLGSMDANLESVYVYGSTLNDNACFSSDIDLIVKVKTKSSETLATIAMLDTCLLTSYKILMADDQSQMSYMLDVHIIDEHDLQQQSGYGSLISSCHTLPIKVWQRA